MTRRRELNLDRAAFLSRYWQREPLLIRNAISNFVPPLPSDELAGLAMEADIESRLIEQRGDTWHLHHGPFREADFMREHAWTLLVQAVDQYIPEVAELQRLVEFLPRWRTDDIMVSYATDGGSVGPHYDNYDVFLLQGEGQRLWRLGQHCDSSTPLLPHAELRILADFDTVHEYLLDPGDILYVPPGVAHWGIAQGECTTFSIGFRAPRTSEMLSRWIDDVLETLDPDLFYRDAGRAAVGRPGELHADDLQRALKQLRRELDRPRDNRWFGELVTETRYPFEPDPDDIAEGIALLRHGATSVELSPAAKLAWQQDAHGLTVFASGEGLACSVSVLPTLLLLCAGDNLAEASLDMALSDTDTAALLDGLLQRGCIHVR